jgi:hypothetical protein
MRVNPTVAETATGESLSKASNGGQPDVLKESLDLTQGEFQYGFDTCMPIGLKVRLEPFPNDSPMSV